MEKERTAASHAATVETLHQRLGRAATEMEAIKREHQGQIGRLQADNQLLASLHRVSVAVCLNLLNIRLFYRLFRFVLGTIRRSQVASHPGNAGLAK